MTTRSPTALSFAASSPPGSLPGRVEEVKPQIALAEGRAESPAGTTLFLTVDVEDSYFDRPILMTGEGVGREFGVFGVLDEFDSNGLKGTFFVNVYEKDSQPAGAVEEVVREIAARGHEVGLHSHPSPALDFYNRPLFRLSRADQLRVLRWGAGLIADWTGAPPTSFRAGAYALNDDTFEALEEAGIPIDSSCFFPSPNNRYPRRTVNAPALQGETIEMPVTTVLRADGDGRLHKRKLDLDWLRPDELTAVLDELSRHGAPFATFMMHSFSFLEKETRTPDQPPSPRARFTSQTRFDRYVEVYGPKPRMRESLSQLCHWLESEPSVRVRTLRDEAQGLRDADSETPDIVPVIGREPA